MCVYEMTMGSLNWFYQCGPFDVMMHSLFIHKITKKNKKHFILTLKLLESNVAIPTIFAVLSMLQQH